MRISDWSSDVCSSDLNAALRYPIDAPKRGATETPNLSSDALSLHDAPFRCVVPPPNLIAVAFLIIGAAQPMSVAIARTASRTSAPSTPPRPTCPQTKSRKIGRAPVGTPVTNAQLVGRLLIEKKKHKNT